MMCTVVDLVLEYKYVQVRTQNLEEDKLYTLTQFPCNLQSEFVMRKYNWANPSITRYAENYLRQWIIMEKEGLVGLIK